MRFVVLCEQEVFELHGLLKLNKPQALKKFTYVLCNLMRFNSCIYIEKGKYDFYKLGGL